MLLLPILIFNQMATFFVIVKLYVVMQWLNFNSKREQLLELSLSATMKETLDQSLFTSN